MKFSVPYVRIWPSMIFETHWLSKCTDILPNRLLRAFYYTKTMIPYQSQNMQQNNIKMALRCNSHTKVQYKLKIINHMYIFKV